MPHIGPTELIIILVIVLVIFGVGRIPEVGGALGKGIRQFRRGISGEPDSPRRSKPKAKGRAKATKKS